MLSDKNNQYREEPLKPGQVDLPDMPRPVNRALLVPGGLLVLMVLIAVSSYLAFGTGSGTDNATVAIVRAATSPAEVSITSSGFTPATIAIKTGQTVVWTNTDNTPHFISSDSPKPLTKTTPDPNSNQAVSPDNRYSYVFKEAGTYTYHDNLNPAAGGTVIVK